MALCPIARLVCVALVVAPTLGADASEPGVPLGPIVRETVWTLDVDLIAIGPSTNGSIGASSITASRSAPGAAEIVAGTAGAWPNGTLRLSVTLERLSEDEATFDFLAVLARPGHPEVKCSRRFALTEGGSQVIEIFGEGERRLLVSIRGEEGTRPVVRRLASVGSPLLFRVEIEKIDGERVVALETNDLNTFVGEPVEYSFDFGGDEERLRLVLTPVSVTGSIAQVRALISGQLPAASGPILLSRDQMFAASRGATSSVDVVTGDPPRGYRFRITPEF